MEFEDFLDNEAPHRPDLELLAIFFTGTMLRTVFAEGFAVADLGMDRVLLRDSLAGRISSLLSSRCEACTVNQFERLESPNESKAEARLKPCALGSVIRLGILTDLRTLWREEGRGRDCVAASIADWALVLLPFKRLLGFGLHSERGRKHGTQSVSVVAL